MNRYTTIILFLIFFLSFEVYPQYLNENTYEPNTIVVKLKNHAVLSKSSGNISVSSAVHNFLSTYNVTSISPAFIVKDQNHPLANIIHVKYASGVDPVVLSQKISKLDDVIWAEPNFVYKVDHTPNDTSYSKQWYLTKILAEQAWDISTGDPSIVIGIVDTGVDWDHPDLAANIWTNPGEIADNGIDDDNNGFIDDIHGWDFGGLTGTPDNNPVEDKADHGTNVAGIACAVSNNVTGVASIGYKCKIMPVKASRDNYRDQNGNVYIAYSPEASLYAIDNGADIINCSFGSNQFSNAGKELIQYALSKGVLVVAAAGNENSTKLHYPSAYDGVLSVASSGPNDLRSSFSNYGRTIEVCAPGESIYNTWFDNTYEYLSGTSMSSPLVAGLAALVKTKFPSYTPQQIAEQIRTNCDNIDNLNQGYKFWLGAGRVNAFKALNNLNSKSVRAFDVEFSDQKPNGNGNGILEPDENILVHVKFRNYLSPLQNLNITLESEDQNTIVENQSTSPGALGTLDSLEHEFLFTVAVGAGINAEPKLVLKFSDGDYIDYQAIGATINPPYYIENTGAIDLTITNKGSFGFYDYPDNSVGSGLKYKDGNNILFEGALMMGNSATKVSDAARGDDGSTQNTEFQFRKKTWKSPGDFSDHQGLVLFNDNGAYFSRLKVDIAQYSYSFESDPLNKFIIFKYFIKSTNSAEISNLFVGLFFDWDMTDGTADNARYNDEENFGYVYHQNGSSGTYAGAALISSDTYGYYAILNDGSDKGINIYDGFTNDEKFRTLSHGLSKKQAGPGDISQVISSGPFTIPVGDSIEVAFALAAGDNLDDLKNVIKAARDKYAEVFTGVANNSDVVVNEFRLVQNYPNPFNPSTRIKYSIAGISPVEVQLKVYDILGKTVATLVNEVKSAGQYSVTFDASGLSSGIYFYELKAGTEVAAKKMLLIR